MLPLRNSPLFVLSSPIIVWCALLTPVQSAEKTVRVKTADELRSAVRAAKPGTKIEIAPGDYAGGLRFENLRGEKGKPVIITGADPKKPPVFTGGPNGMHLVNPSFVEVRDLEITGTSANGISVDDAGKFSPEPRDLVLHGLKITNVGPKGNCDAIKLSGLYGFRVENCTAENWGIGSGSGIDMVGCHNGVIEGCTFRHVEGMEQTGGSGVQAKGGSANVVIRKCRFENAGQRAVNIGGSTGADYYRPPLSQWPEGTPKFEGKDIIVEGNTFAGSLSPLAFVGVDGATVRFNTIYRPGKWLMRILQETKDPAFVPCRGGIITDNVILFDSSQWSENGVNTSGGTAPETFKFARNHWFCLDRPDRSKPRLPSAEEDGDYGKDPLVENAETLDLRLKKSSPAKGKGADALPEGSRQ